MSDKIETDGYRAAVGDKPPAPTTGSAIMRSFPDRRFYLAAHAPINMVDVIPTFPPGFQINIEAVTKRMCHMRVLYADMMLEMLEISPEELKLKKF